MTPALVCLLLAVPTADDAAAVRAADVERYLAKCESAWTEEQRELNRKIEVLAKQDGRTAQEDRQLGILQALAWVERGQPAPLLPLALPPAKGDVGTLVPPDGIPPLEVLEIIDADDAIVRAWFAAEASEPRERTVPGATTFIDVWIHGVDTSGFAVGSSVALDAVFHVAGNQVFDTTCGGRSVPRLDVVDHADFRKPAAERAAALEPIPEKLVVLTFDDSAKSHYTVVRPILKQYGFGATFFITEGFDFQTDKERYMTWDEIAALDRDGFEIGNHTADHMVLDPGNPEELSRQLGDLKAQLETINARCREHGIARPTSFAYPGNRTAPAALPILAELGIRFARRGGSPEFPYDHGQGVAYEPGLDHPLLVPSAGDARPAWTLDDFVRAVEQAELGRIAVLQFHGVPDEAHDWVSTPVETFKAAMNYLATHDYLAIAMRDLARYVDPRVAPGTPEGVIADRQRAIESGKSRDESRPPTSDDELRGWLENMVWHHGFSVPEIRQATGLSVEEVSAALARFDIRPETKPARETDAPLLVLPYPGGRHPRVGFLDGAIRPQRETKLSVFLPWDEARYVVVDAPEAIRRDDEAEHGLLYLAHTHVDTKWTKQGLALAPLEWRKLAEGGYEVERTLPNGVRFGTRATPAHDAVRMEMWLTNGSDETLRELRVQNCVMLKRAPEFASEAEDATIFDSPFVARRSSLGERWLIVAWEPCQRTWANPPCPCLHSDPQFADCAPGETSRLRGWLSFYEGSDIRGELQRIRDEGWLKGDAPQDTSAESRSTP